MKKSAVTLETIAQTLVNMQADAVRTQGTIEQIQTTIGGMQTTIGGIQTDLKDVHSNLNDVQKSVEFLVEHAVMREELRPIIREEIKLSESRMISHMEGFIGEHRTMKEEVLVHGYRLGVIEHAMGLPSAA